MFCPAHEKQPSEVRGVHFSRKSQMLSVMAAAVMASALMPSAALANPVATVASCEGIKTAFPILGKSCETAYAKINHSPANAADRQSTYQSRVQVLEIFQKTLLCNGMNGAKKDAQDRFKSGEQGHLEALSSLHASMEKAGDAKVPALYTSSNLKSVKINKAQCK